MNNGHFIFKVKRSIIFIIKLNIQLKYFLISKINKYIKMCDTSNRNKSEINSVLLLVWFNTIGNRQNCTFGAIIVIIHNKGTETWWS